MSVPALAAVPEPVVTSPAEPPVVLAAHGVGKMYRLYDRPQDRLMYQLLWRFGRSYGREFWALRDVSVAVRRGEVLGIIGRNGSGKSTLLQLLAGVLHPTTGRVQVGGRVAALLELGSGFNPEFTGRENVYLNGAIMGFTREEMAARFDAIAAFADIGAFIDQPVKLYSSGMFVRLAFAVATSVEADVLLVDEALAVGDVFFRQKCYGRLEELRARGVAIVFVSHAMLDVEQLCDRVVLLNAGQMLFAGDASEAVKRYYLLDQEGRGLSLVPTAPPAEVASEAPSFDWPPPAAFLDIRGKAQVANGWARCTAVAVCNEAGEPCRVFEQGETAHFYYEFELLHDIEVPIGGVQLQNSRGVIVHGKNTLEYGTEVPEGLSVGTRLRFHHTVALELAADEYTCDVGLGAMATAHYARRGTYQHQELDQGLLRLCNVPGVCDLAVIMRRRGKPVQLLHHGIANLPGHCSVVAIAGGEG